MSGEAISVLAAVAGIVPSTHIRLFSPFERLSLADEVTFELIADTAVDAAQIARSDVLIVQRSTSALMPGVFRAARAQGVPVVYECDDNFLEITRDVDVVGAYYSDPFVQRLFKQSLRAADVVTVSTPVLAEAFAQYARRVQLLPNCIDPEYVGEACPAADEGPVIIGYAGTVTHNADFEVVWPALKRILAESPSVRMSFQGFIPEELRDSPNVSFVPYAEDYPGFLGQLGSLGWSFAVAPLADKPFNHGKTDNKFREYSACLIPAVYSDIPVYSRSVEDGETGLLVPHTTEGWYAGLRRMLDEPALRARIRGNANRVVMERYSCEKAASAWLELLKELVWDRREE
ncbi:MAG TPA: glycosyltransferase [Coriobacteriia bacterium]|jgi:glycosyltransferase involved in cell wall biosynthesis